MTDDRLRELIDGHFQGTLSSTERQQLDELLVQSPLARQQLVQAARLHVQLFLTLNRDTVVEPGPPQLAQAMAADGRSRIRLPAPLSGMRRIAQEFVWQPLSLVLLVIALVSGAVLIWQLSQTSSRPIGGGKGTDENTRASRARLTRATGAKWGRADSRVATDVPPRMFEGMNLAAGDRLVLEEGLAEVAFISGVTVLLQGPAELVVGEKQRDGKGEEQLESNAVFLAKGRLVARVAPEGRGFAVDTPVARIVDLGTEFGVHVNLAAAAPSTEVEVFQGRVTLQQKISATQEPSSAVSESIELSAGEAALCQAGAKVRRYNSNASAFVKRMPATAIASSQAAWPRDSMLKPGDIVAVTSDDLKLVKIDAKTGAQSLLATGKRSSHGNWSSVAISRRGTVLIGAAGLPGGKLGILRIDPRDGAITTLGNGRTLAADPTDSIVGLAEGAGGNIIAAVHGAARSRVVMVDPVTGTAMDMTTLEDAQGIQIESNGRDVLVAAGQGGVGLLQQTFQLWNTDHLRIGTAWSVALGRDERVLVASNHGDTRQILEIGRAGPHAITTIAELPSSAGSASRWNLAAEASGNLIASPTASDSRIFRIDVRTGQAHIVSAGGLLGGETFVAIVPQ